MIQITKLIIILIIFVGFSSNLRASDKIKTDSIKVTQIIKEFYGWYLTAIQEKKYSDFKPKFAESENGMATLNYEEYIENLTRLKFSESLIIKEKLSYSDCIENLKNVRFKDFQQSVFTDLGEYEQANCDFGNYYRWIGGQEPIGGIRIKNIEFVAVGLALASIDYFDIDSNENEKKYYGKNTLRMIKLNQEWLIDKIESWQD